MAELEEGDTLAQVCARARERHAAVTFSCLDCGQVNLMRFSALFQQPAPRPAEVVPVRAETSAAQAADAPPQVPVQDELDPDARVRLVGEWQLFEG